MKVILTLVLALMTFLSAGAYKYTYSFNNTPISQAILRICKDHPDEKIAFIYKELDNYRTSAKIRTNDTYSALLQTVGINPVSVVKNGKEYYIEALQHGRFIYRGQAVGSDNLPVSAATVMLLAPNDSTVLTYGIADGEGRFSHYHASSHYCYIAAFHRDFVPFEHLNYSLCRTRCKSCIISCKYLCDIFR